MCHHPESLSQWAGEVSKHLPHLSRCQALGLAMYSYGTVVLRCCGLSMLSTFWAELVDQKPNTVRQRLRETLYDAPDKRGHKRCELDVTTCFAPLLQWVLAWWDSSDQRLALALDATNLGQRFTVLCLSVVYRGCALPVAWVVLSATKPDKWMPHLTRLVKYLMDVVPTTWQVIVLTDRGLYSKALYRAIQRNGWHPVMRINAQGNFRPAGVSRFRPLANLLPQPETLWYGQAACFSTATCRLDCTLLAYWRTDCKEPWLLVTDLPPADADPLWYGMRMWIEHGFKDDKRGGFRWEQTKMTDPARAARLWLVLALAHLWTMSVGGEAEVDDLALPDLVLAPAFPATTTPRLLSCLNRGWIRIIVALITHRPLPMGRFSPEPWPTLPLNRPMLDLLMLGGHFVSLKTYP